ncbi:MAG TPA: hypothetical protein VLF93_07070 [Candidatus Saccharimonadales bacterium]|nr:hypothetical protein [Candidatus Saccharimonadales bacterium]
MPVRAIDSEGRNSDRALLNESALRISCSAFARITDTQGNYLLLTNIVKKRQGKTVLTPVGGAIEATPQGITVISEMLGLTPESFDEGNDLRFVMNGKGVNTLLKWFLTRKDRETDPYREIVEELVTESGVLTDTDIPELESTPVSFAGYFGEIGLSTRSGQSGKLTLRLSEIHDVGLSERLVEKLKRAETGQFDDVLRFVSEDEIMAGRTTDGIEIGSVANGLCRPQHTIGEIT